MSNGDDERKKRLSILCKQLRGEESLRSFTKNRSNELRGISHASWSAWEGERAGLSADSLDRLVTFIGCSHQSFYAYLDGLTTLEELLQPSNDSNDSKKEIDFSFDTTSAWIKSLEPKEQLFIATQSFQAFQERFDKFIKIEAKGRTELLLQLLSSSSYPDDTQIEVAAQKLDISVEDLRRLCDRVFK